MQGYLSNFERNLQNWEFKPFNLTIMNIKSQPQGGNLWIKMWIYIYTLQVCDEHIQTSSFTFSSQQKISP